MSDIDGPVDVASVEPIVGTWSLLRGFFRVRQDPDPFLAGLARRAIDNFAFPLADRRLLDLGSGTGHLGHQLARLGHNVVSTDLSFDDLVSGRPPAAFNGDATALGVRTESVDGVICSNILEHTPTPDLVFDEIARILVDDGWAWVSWTPWWGPFGGHAIAPMHYFGAERGLRWYTRLFGPPTGHNLPDDGVWPTTIGEMLAIVEQLDDLELLEATPRYYPRLRWLMRLKRTREVAAWNCLLLIRRRPRAQVEAVAAGANWSDFDEVADLDPEETVDAPRPPPSTVNTVVLTLFVTFSVLAAAAVAYFATNSEDSDEAAVLEDAAVTVTTDVVSTTDETPSTSLCCTSTTATTTTTTTTTIAELIDATERDVSGIGVFDSFSRADTDEVGMSEAGDTWFEVAGDWAVQDASVVLVEPSTAGPSLMVASMGAVDGTVQFTMSTIDVAAGLVFRYVDQNNYWAITAAPGFSTWSVAQVINGVTEVRGSAGLVPSVDTTTVSVHLNGPFITVFVDGVRSVALVDPGVPAGSIVGLTVGGPQPSTARWTNFVAIGEVDPDAV